MAIIDIGKSILILFVLLFGLMILNVVVVFSDMLFIRIGIPYCAATITLVLLYVNIFKALKERIQFSTPFGRIISNNAVLNAEKQINNNLASLKKSIQKKSTDKNLLQLKKLLEDTRRLVINREELNLK